MNAQLDKIIDAFKAHLRGLRDCRDEARGQIITSRLMIERSYALLNKIEAEQTSRIGSAASLRPE